MSKPRSRTLTRVPGAVALGVFIAVLAVYLVALSGYRASLHRNLRDDTRTLLTVLTARLSEFANSHIAAATLLRDTWEVNGERRVKLAEELTEEFPGFQSLQWMDAAGVIRWNYPPGPNAAAIGLNVKTVPAAAEALRLAAQSHRPAVSAPLELAQGGRGVVVYYPILTDPPGGYLGAVFRIRPFIQRVFSDDLSRDYALRILDQGQPVFGRLPEDAPANLLAHDDLTVGNRHWSVDLVPLQGPPLLTAEWLGIVLVGGVLVVLLPLLSFVWLKSIQRREEAELITWRAANFDPLTQMPNRRRLQSLIDHPRRQAATGRLLVLINVTNLRMIAVLHGSDTSNAVLTQVAARLSAAFAKNEVFQIADDEFALLLGEGHGDSEHVLATVSRIFEKSFTVGEARLDVHAVLGYARSRHGADSFTALYSDASAALVEARETGAPTGFDEELRTRRQDRAALEADLRKALENRELHLVYQPIIELASGELRGVEALMRWHHPQRGMVPPDVFIPIAEQLNLIDELGRWALETAVSTLSDWHYATGSGVGVSVNLSARQLLNLNLPHVVNEVLQRHAVEPRYLTLEITESLLIENLRVATRLLEGLKRVGVSISLDDFGTGYSSLSYLTALPLSVVKLDRSFLQHASQSDRAEAFFESLIGLAHRLDLRVVAEGVEEQSQADALLRQGCDYAQGYYYGKPMQAAEIEALLRRA